MTPNSLSGPGGAVCHSDTTCCESKASENQRRPDTLLLALVQPVASSPSPQLQSPCLIALPCLAALP